ncbi:MAG: SnoaL-like polyketide cyclase [Pseudonocardiales bacterium]|nr:SnoaL-like polyketide cyclase [Pseudonocardiales bacterium]
MTDGRACEVDALSRALVGTWNRADWSAYRALTAGEYCYEETGSGRRIDDVDLVLADWRRVRSVFPDVGAELVDVLTRGDTSVVGLVWRATHSAPVETADGVESPSYKRIHIGDSVTLTWQGGLLATEHHQIGFLSVLAAIPAVMGGAGRCC